VYELQAIPSLKTSTEVIVLRKVYGDLKINERILILCAILPAALGPGVYSASNRNEYQKHKNNNVSGEQSAVGA
jgi:hypothetical protein